MEWVEADGKSKRDHLKEEVEGLLQTPSSVTAAAVLEAYSSEPPETLADLWAHFMLLHAARRRDMDGPCRLAYDDVKGYSGLFAASFPSWQLRAILRLDQTYLSVYLERKDKK